MNSSGGMKSSQRGQISIDKVVTLRSSVLPLYVIIRPDGRVTAADEVSDDGSDFLTTRMWGDQISFQSIRGDYLSVENDQVCTRRYCSADERFVVEKRDTQYALRARSGKYLSVLDREPYLQLAGSAGDTEIFQLFSLIIDGVNVGKQLELLERSGSVFIDGMLPDDQLEQLKRSVAEVDGAYPPPSGGHDRRQTGLAGLAPSFAQLAGHPIVSQLAQRMISSRVQLSDMESVRTDAAYVRTELEVTEWHVVYPYSSVEFPGIAESRASLTATWFLDDLDQANSTWAWVKAPNSDGNYLPKLPQLSSPEEVTAITKSAAPLAARRGTVWLYLGPIWMSNNIGAASYWKDYDAQTRYKHLSGQKEQTSFRSITDAQKNNMPREDLCPTVIQATYVREFIAPRCSAPLAAGQMALQH